LRRNAEKDGHVRNVRLLSEGPPGGGEVVSRKKGAHGVDIDRGRVRGNRNIKHLYSKS